MTHLKEVVVIYGGGGGNGIPNITHTQNMSPPSALNNLKLCFAPPSDCLHYKFYVPSFSTALHAVNNDH